MKHLFITLSVFILLLVGCEKEPNPLWEEPQLEMTTSQYAIVADTKVANSSLSLIITDGEMKTSNEIGAKTVIIYDKPVESDKVNIIVKNSFTDYDIADTTFNLNIENYNIIEIRYDEMFLPNDIRLITYEYYPEWYFSQLKHLFK